MFATILLESGKQLTPEGVVLTLFFCLMAGVYFGCGMYFFAGLTAMHPGTFRRVARQRTNRERAMSLLALPFAAAPFIYVLALDRDYLWPVIAVAVASFLPLSPLRAHAFAGSVLLRALLCFALGMLVCAGSYQYLSDGFAAAPGAHTLLLAAGSSASLCVSYLLSIYAHRPVEEP